MNLLFPTVVYAPDPALDVAEFSRVLEESGLGATRPLSDPARLQQMLLASDLVMTARLGAPDGRLVGVARCLSDGAWVCYLSELAVCKTAQGLSVGTGLIQAVRQDIGPRVSLILAATDDAVGFYRQIGMPELPNAFCYKRHQ